MIRTSHTVHILYSPKVFFCCCCWCCCFYHEIHLMPFSVFSNYTINRNGKSTGSSENLSTNKILMKPILLQKPVTTHHSVSFSFFFSVCQKQHLRSMVGILWLTAQHWNSRCVFGIFSIIFWFCFCCELMYKCRLLKNLPLQTISFPFLWERFKWLSVRTYIPNAFIVYFYAKSKKRKV